VRYLLLILKLVILITTRPLETDFGIQNCDHASQSVQLLRDSLPELAEACCIRVLPDTPRATNSKIRKTDSR
jgi:hypothetical protein